MSMFTKAVVSSLLLGLSATTGGSQTQAQGPGAFTSENAILDTSILFAIGAREARQELRGSFGWPTFQEGLVEGVYFRFDPDGYARFSPNPRLDTDVFEVICRPRTYSCMGRKGTLSFMLNSRGQFQLKLDAAHEGDQFFVVEGISELEVPARILQPLDDRFTTLLSSSEELVIRRGQNEVDRISLVGFAAVSAYLRWISARQDYTILPRGWPVPNSLNDGEPANLTQAANWQSPMPQPQSFLLQAGPETVGSEVAEVRGELNVLRELFLDRQNDSAPPVTREPVENGRPSPSLSSDTTNGDRIAELERNAEMIMEELERIRALRTGNASQPNGSAIASPVRPLSSTNDQLDQAPVEMHTAVGHQQGVENSLEDKETEPTRIAQQLEYLMTEIGLDAQTALMIVEMGSRPDQSTEKSESATPKIVAELYQDNLVAEIIKELRIPIDEKPALSLEEETASVPDIAPAEYMLLTDYFRSVITQREAEQ